MPVGSATSKKSNVNLDTNTDNNCSKRKKYENTSYHCLDVWAISPKVLEIKDEGKKKKVIDALVRSNGAEPFPKDSLSSMAPITLFEEFLAISVLLLWLGGPLFWIFSTVAVLVAGDFKLRLGAIIISLILMYHPVSSPLPGFMESSVTRALFKYFTYRFVWVNDNQEAALLNAPWIGVSPPHGVMPFANVLSIPGINLYFGVNFVGAGASVVQSIPFLRYMASWYPFITVDKHLILKAVCEQNTCVGIVPDGIAGIFRQNHSHEAVAMKNRKGIARLCLRTGTNVLPAYSFGNTLCLSSWFDRFGILENVSRKSQASIFLYWGRFGLPIPRRVPITMAIGKTIIVKKVVGEPTQNQIDILHEQILNGIRDCFENHKSALGWGDKQLVFCD